MKRKTVGTFNVEGEKLHVSDPCYEYEEGVVVKNALSGKWVAEVLCETYSNWGFRVIGLVVTHKDFIHAPRYTIKKHGEIEVGVDSGQMSIFDDAFYAENQGGEYDEEDSFYGEICTITLDDEQAGIYKQKGVVCATGFGDGTYCASIGYANVGEKAEKKVVSIYIDFLDKEEE